MSALGACLLATACGRSDDDAQGLTRGRELLSHYQCGSCHMIPEVPAARSQVAITLAHMGSRSYIAGRVPNTDENLARWIVDPEKMVPGTLMPSMGVTPEDARHMAAYLRSLK